MLEAIDTVRPRPPVVATTVHRARPRRRVAGLVAAAAALVAIGGVGATVWHPWSDDANQAPTLTAGEVIGAAMHSHLDRAATRRIPRAGHPFGIAQRSGAAGHGMAPAGEGKVYQLWLQHDDVMVPAGFIPDQADATVLLNGDAASADGFGITREPAGGSKQPTRPPVALIEFEQPELAEARGRGRSRLPRRGRTRPACR